MSFISSEALDFQRQSRRLLSPRGIAIAGLFAALYVILSFFNIRLSPLIEIRFPFLILAAVSLFGGPLMGIASAITADIVSTLLTGGAFFFGFTFSYSLMAFLFGLIFCGSRLTIPRAISGAVVECIISLSFHTLWLSMMYGSPLKALFFTRLPKCLVMLPVNAFLLFLVLRIFKKVFAQTDLMQDSPAAR